MADLNDFATAVGALVKDARWTRGIIQSGTDLDTLTTPGVYRISSSTVANSVTPALPAAARNVGVLEVLEASGITYVVQRWSNAVGSVKSTWQRELLDTTWTAWRQTDASAHAPRFLPASANIDTYVRSGGAYDGDWVVDGSVLGTVTGLPEPRAGLLTVDAGIGSQTYQAYAGGLWWRGLAALNPLTWKPWARLDISTGSEASRTDVGGLWLNRPSGTGATRTTAEFSIRLPLPLQGQANRGIRIGFSTADSAAATTSAATVNITGVYVGRGVRDSDGNLTGQFATAPTALGAVGALPKNGARVFTEWGANGMILDRDTIVSYGYTADGTNAYPDAVGACWRTFNSADASALTPTGYTGIGGAVSGSSPLSMVAELRSSAAKVLVIGDSHMVSVAATKNLWEAPAALASSNIIPSIVAVGGTRLSSWAASSALWNEAALTQADRVVIALGANDIFGSNRPLADLQSDFKAIVARVRTAQGSVPIFAGTVWPRNAAVGGSSYADMETTRAAFNEWLYSLPAGIAGVIPEDALIDPSSGLIDARWISGDGVHLSTAGAARFAQVMRQQIG